MSNMQPSNTTQTTIGSQANINLTNPNSTTIESPTIEAPTTLEQAQNTLANTNNPEAAMITPGNGIPLCTNANGNQTITITNTLAGTNNANIHHSHHNTTTYNINFPNASTNGPLT